MTAPRTWPLARPGGPADPGGLARRGRCPARTPHWPSRSALGSRLLVAGPRHGRRACAFDPRSARSGFQLVELGQWIPSWGVSFTLGVDGIALVLILMTASWCRCASSPAGRTPTRRFGDSARSYFAWILVLEGLVIGVFAATDVFLFYVLFEAMLDPDVLPDRPLRRAQRQYAAVKFFLYSLVGGLLMLAALVGLYVVSARQPAAGTFDYAALVGLDIDPDTQQLAVPRASSSPSRSRRRCGRCTPGCRTPRRRPRRRTSVLLVGVLDKVGTFGMLRLCLPLFPDASQYFTPAIIVLSLIGIVYGALLAIGQTDLKRLIAYTSVSHFGFIALGIFAMTSQGQSGATLYMVNHGFSIAALFLLVGFLARAAGRALDRRLRRRAEGGPGPGRAVPGRRACPRWRCPGSARSSRSSWSWPARSRVYPMAAVIATRRHRAGRALHPADVPADDDRPGGAGGRRGCATCAAARCWPSPRSWRSSSPWAFFPQLALDVINPSVEPDA